MEAGQSLLCGALSFKGFIYQGMSARSKCVRMNCHINWYELVFIKHAFSLLYEINNDILFVLYGCDCARPHGKVFLYKATADVGVRLNKKRNVIDNEVKYL